jgi:hypothetical protein
MLWRQPDVTVESWVEMTHDVQMRYELDHKDHATLYFGQYNDYVLILSRDNLERMVTLANQAITALDAISA